MLFEINFGDDGASLLGFTYKLGSWMHDYPRKLQIYLYTADGEKRRLLNRGDYGAIRTYLEGSSELTLFFDEAKVKKIVFEQTGQEKVFDWTIAELDFYQKSEES